MKLYGSNLKKAEILERIGNISQIGGTRQYEFSDGLSRGIRGIDIKTPAGLDMTVLPDRGMDISYLAYKSIPINWKSSTGETSSMYYESNEDEWLRTFYGGFLTTCGITYMGWPCTDNGEDIGMHGRVSNLAAENVCIDEKWVKDDYVINIQGKIRETKVFGNQLIITRKFTIFMGTPIVFLHDTVENIGFKKSPIMILYHFNLGYPLLDSDSSIIESVKEVVPANEEGEKNFKSYLDFSDPKDGFRSQTFMHDIKSDKEGYCNIALVNPKLNNNQGLGMQIRYKKDTLPYLIHWKHLAKGEYVCGLEPSNSRNNRRIERKNRELKFIEPGEKIDFKLEFTILDKNNEDYWKEVK